MRIDRYITGFLLLCFSVFLGHNLVPHYHLSDSNCSALSTTCPSEQGDRREHDHQSDRNADEENHSAHCHAFNDVILEKFSPLKYNSESGHWQQMLMSGRERVPDAEFLLLPGKVTFYRQACSPSKDIGTQALRAPPSLG